MMEQLTMEFRTASPINMEKFRGQVKTIYEHLENRGTITVFDAIRLYNIYHLHSRISDLRNKCGVQIFDRMIKSGGVDCKEYSLKKFAQPTIVKNCANVKNKM